MLTRAAPDNELIAPSDEVFRHGHVGLARARGVDRDHADFFSECGRFVLLNVVPRAKNPETESDVLLE